MTTFPGNFDLFYTEKRNALLKWRARYERFNYSFKVAQNCYYDVYAVKLIWPTILEIFTDSQKTYLQSRSMSFQEAAEIVVNMKRKTQLELVNPLIPTFLDSIPLGELIDPTGFRALIHAAGNGDNTSVEEMEYTYCYNTMSANFVLYWAAVGMTGRGKMDAYHSLTPVVNPEANFESFAGAMEAFFAPVSHYLAPVMGNYVPLPPLW